MIKSDQELEKTINENQLNKTIPFQYDTFLSQCILMIQKRTFSYNLFYVYQILNSRSSLTSHKLKLLELLTYVNYQSRTFPLTELIYYLTQIYQTNSSFNSSDLQTVHKLFSFVIVKLANEKYYETSRMLYENIFKELNNKNSENNNDKELGTNIPTYEEQLLKQHNKRNELLNSIDNVDKYFEDNNISLINIKQLIELSKDNFTIEPNHQYVIITKSWSDLLEKWVNDNDKNITTFPFVVNNHEVLQFKQKQNNENNYQIMLKTTDTSLIRFVPLDIYEGLKPIIINELEFKCSFRKECLINEIEIVNMEILFFINLNTNQPPISFVHTVHLFKQQINTMDDLYTDICEQCLVSYDPQLQINIFTFKESNSRLYDEIQVAHHFGITNYCCNNKINNSFRLINNIDDFFNTQNTNANDTEHTFIICDISNDSPYIIYNNNNECIECKNTRSINNNDDIVLCSYCNYGVFCSEECLIQNKEHIKHHYILSNIFPNIGKFKHEPTFMLYKAVCNKEIYSFKTIMPYNYKKPKGIKNLGNSCYMSVSLQCLFHTQIFISYFLDVFNNINNSFLLKDKTSVVVNSLYDLIVKYYDNSQTQSLDPLDFKQTLSLKLPQFKTSSQQDAHEFLIHLLNTLDNELKTSNETTTIISDIFTGETKSTIVCDKCNTHSSRIESFNCLQLDVPLISTKKTKHTRVKFFYYKDINSFELLHHVEEIEIYKDTTIENIKTFLMQYSRISNTDCNHIISVSVDSKKKLIIRPLPNDEHVKNCVSLGNEITFYETHPKGVEGCIFINQILNNTTTNTYNYYNNIEVDYPIAVPLFNKQPTIEEITNCYRTSLNSLFSKDNSTLNENDITFYYNHFKGDKKCIFCKGNYTYRCKITSNLDKLMQTPFYIPKILFAYHSTSTTTPLLPLIEPNPFIGGIYYKQPGVTIQKCFSSLFAQTIFDGDNKYFCEKCKAYNKAIKTVSLNKLPLSLIIQLNRQNNNQVPSTNILTNLLSQNTKNELIVDYKDVIHIGNDVFELYAVIVHKLSYYVAWHYTCYCKDMFTNKWRLFNDSKVTEVNDINEIIDKNACLLFYRKC